MFKGFSLRKKAHELSSVSDSISRMRQARIFMTTPFADRCDEVEVLGPL